METVLSGTIVMVATRITVMMVLIITATETGTRQERRRRLALGAPLCRMDDIASSDAAASPAYQCRFAAEVGALTRRLDGKRMSGRGVTPTVVGAHDAAVTAALRAVDAYEFPAPARLPPTVSYRELSPRLSSLVLLAARLLYAVAFQLDGLLRPSPSPPGRRLLPAAEEEASAATLLDLPKRAPGPRRLRPPLSAFAPSDCGAVAAVGAATVVPAPPVEALVKETSDSRSLRRARAALPLGSAELVAVELP